MRVQTFCQEREEEKDEEQFAILPTFWFGTLPVFLTLINDSASFAIGTSPKKSLHECEAYVLAEI